MMVANLKKNRFPMDDILAADSVPNRLQPNCLNNLINHKRLKIAVLIREAKKAKEEGKQKVILLNWSGHGLVDMAAYEAYLTGRLKNYELPQEEIDRALAEIAPLPKPKQYRK